MDNYPDNIRYPGDTKDPASPFYEGGRCDQCHQDFDDCDCCLVCGQPIDDCEYDGECRGDEGE